MVNGWGGEDRDRRKFTAKNKPKKGMQLRTANNRLRNLKKRRNENIRNRTNKLRGIKRSNKGGNLSALVAAANENENENENENANVGLNFGGGGGGGGGGAQRFEFSSIVKPKAVRAYPPVASAFAFQPHPAEPPAAAPPAPAPARRARGMAFNMSNLEAALPLNAEPSASAGGGGGGAAAGASRKNNRKTRN